MSAAYSTSLFEDDWQACAGTEDGLDGLGPVAAYNAGLDEIPHNDIDPQLRTGFVDPRTCHGNDSKQPVPNDPGAVDLPTSSYASPPPMCISTTEPASPYFIHSIEQSFAPESLTPRTPYHAPSPLQYELLPRRSVSEPPGGHPSQPTFTRKGHAIGVPMPKQATRTKQKGANGLPRGRPMNAELIVQMNRARSATPSATPIERSQTQQMAPTSMPYDLFMMNSKQEPCLVPMQAPLYQQHNLTGPQGCTPTPANTPQFLASHGPTSQPVTQLALDSDSRTVAALSVDELRSMIGEVVEEALRGKKRKRSLSEGSAGRGRTRR